MGALSIVRFRAAIKEPEELAFLFITIGIGLGFGADQSVITIAAVFVIIFAIIILKKLKNRNSDSNLINLSISSKVKDNINLQDIISILETNCEKLEIIRFDQNQELIDCSFNIIFQDYTKLLKSKNELIKYNKNINISFIENSIQY